ncbi:ribosomal protein L36 [Ancylostoma duodenale]|uniref:Large ribosomal subunit protein bL36m n=1 Tax=Ancylostoma duodenale TaxID=51022 RepID=A0A0C2CXN8_9BILA|nr:ribosomal protein L36 [Ancylostoma duodenale]
MREAYLKTPSPYKEDNIKNGAKFSPEAQIEAKRKISSQNRSSRMKSSLLPWCVALSVVFVEVKARLKLRCRSCYFIRVNGRLHVECSEHPRHKTREIFNTKLLWHNDDEKPN